MSRRSRRYRGAQQPQDPQALQEPQAKPQEPQELWWWQVADPWTWEDGGLAVGTIIIPKLGLQPKPFGEA